MKTKHLREFVALFACLPDAELILSGKNEWLSEKDPMDAQLEIISINARIEEIHRNNSPFLTALYDEMNHNLYKYSLNQREYIEDILISFKEYAPFIDEEEYYKEEGEFDWLDKRYRNFGATCKLFTRYEEDCERYSVDHYSIIEQYVLNCYFLMYSFFSYLDGRCVHFKLDLMQIQNEMNIFLRRRRYVDHLVDAGYSSKVKQLGIDDVTELKALPPSPDSLNSELPEPKALPPASDSGDSSIVSFTEWLHHDDPVALAGLCKEIFNRKSSPKNYAIMLSLLLEDEIIYLPEKHRREFYESWYIFIGKAIPANNNYNSINKHLDVFNDGIRFANDTDPDYLNLRNRFIKGLEGLVKKAI